MVSAFPFFTNVRIMPRPCLSEVYKAPRIEGEKGGGDDLAAAGKAGN